MSTDNGKMTRICYFMLVTIKVVNEVLVIGLVVVVVVVVVGCGGASNNSR